MFIKNLPEDLNTFRCQEPYLSGITYLFPLLPGLTGILPDLHIGQASG
jgi:hypothetical protein